MKVLANFVDEFDGVQYQPGDEVKGLDEGTRNFLAGSGRVTLLGDDDPEVTAVGNAGPDAVTGKTPASKVVETTKTVVKAN